jgi:hypothetical protein
VFFSKNPNFKWYKLPAPPLRTLSTRPTNERTIASPSSFNGDEIDESTIKERVARKVTAIAVQQNASGIGQFKFAAIDQMGGLTSLMTMDTQSVVGCIDKEDEKAVDVKAKKRKLEDHLELLDDQDLYSGKSHRACKGKRYEQFMTPSKKATKQKSTNSVIPSASVQFPHNGYCKTPEVSHPKQDDSSDELSHIAAERQNFELEQQRNADANDFKLNEKIMTLPSLDLDDYLNRKKAMKKKKKFTRKLTLPDSRALITARRLDFLRFFVLFFFR